MNKYRKFQILLTNMLFCIVAMLFCAVCAQGQIPVVFRYDDYSAGLCEDVFFVEKRLFEIHEKYHIPLAIGVIPMGWNKPLTDDPERLFLLKELINKGIAEVGIHGFSHENHSADAIKSEFRDVPYNIQLEKLSLSKKYLKKWLNHDVTIFMPPWNTYDVNTLKILELLDFSILSASFYGGPKAEPPLVSVPYWTTIPKEAMQFIKLIERQTDYPPVIFLLHAYDFYESKSNRAFLHLADYENLIRFIAQSNKLEIQTLTKLSGNKEALLQLQPKLLHADELIGVKMIDLMSKLKMPGFVITNFVFAGSIVGFKPMLLLWYFVAFILGLLLFGRGFYKLNFLPKRLIIASGIVLFFVVLLIAVSNNLFIGVNLWVKMSSSLFVLFFAFCAGCCAGSLILLVKDWSVHSQKPLVEKPAKK